MLNRNYKTFISGIMNGNTSVTLNTYSQYNVNNRSFSAESWKVVTDPTISPGTIYATTGMSIILGGGNQEESVDDISLENLIDGLTYVTSSMTQLSSDYTKLISVTYKNNTTNSVVVKEIGLLLQEINSGGYWRRALLGRIVLDAPVIMNPGDSYIFTYGVE